MGNSKFLLLCGLLRSPERASEFLLRHAACLLCGCPDPFCEPSLFDIRLSWLGGRISSISIFQIFFSAIVPVLVKVWLANIVPPPLCGSHGATPSRLPVMKHVTIRVGTSYKYLQRSTHVAPCASIHTHASIVHRHRFQPHISRGRWKHPSGICRARAGGSAWTDDADMGCWRFGRWHM